MKQAFQRISQSLAEMAFITGLSIRVLHVVFNTHGPELDWHSFVGTFLVLPILLLAAATIHLANYPVKEWLWRAPVFAIAEAVTEAFASLVLIALGRERWGTGRAEMGDWPSMAGTILMVRFLVVCVFALVLGAVVQAVRRRELRVERQHLHAQHAAEHAAAQAAARTSPSSKTPPSSPA